MNRKMFFSVIHVDIIPYPKMISMHISILIKILPSKISFTIVSEHWSSFRKHHHRSPSPPPKFHLPIPRSIHVESDGELDDDDDEHRLSLHHFKEQNITMFENTHHEQTSDDEQVSRLIDRGRMFSICPIMDLLINNAYLSNDDISD